MKTPQRGRLVAGKYALENAIGQGGMGEVWVARHTHNGRRFALKLLKKSAIESAEMRSRFEREARLAAGLASPHIAQVTDSGLDEEGDPYIVLELLEGEDLHARLRREGRLPVPAVTRLATQIGKALRAAHGASLVHRDLKPANIFLARQDDEEIVKVLDFGIAKSQVMAATEYTEAGAMLGTATYMSPEHVRNAKTVDHRADLWAFAVVLFRALTGELPFELTGLELYIALSQDPIPRPLRATSLLPGLPAPLDVFFERAFSQDIERRYPTAAAMVEGFCRAVGAQVPAGEAGSRASGPPPEVRASAPGPAPVARASMPVAAAATMPVAPASMPVAAPATMPVAPAPPGDSSRPTSPRTWAGSTVKLDDMADPPAQAGGLAARPVPPPRPLASTLPDIEPGRVPASRAGPPLAVWLGAAALLAVLAVAAAAALLR